jgi:hypothetical protein
MQISKLSEECLQLKDKKANVLVGYLLANTPRVEAQIVVSPGELNKEGLAKVSGNPFVIQWPGEYEISDISVFGIKQIFIVEGEGIRVCYLSDPQLVLTEEQVEDIDGIDVLTFCLKEGKTDVKAVAKNTSQIQPKLVIPMGESGLVKQFLKEIGQEEPKSEKKLTIVKTSLPEETEAIILQDKNG